MGALDAFSRAVDLGETSAEHKSFMDLALSLKEEDPAGDIESLVRAGTQEVSFERALALDWPTRIARILRIKRDREMVRAAQTVLGGATTEEVISDALDGLLASLHVGELRGEIASGFGALMARDPVAAMRSMVELSELVHNKGGGLTFDGWVAQGKGKALKG